MPLKPYKPRHLKKVPATFKLPRWLMDRLREQSKLEGRSQAKIIEDALDKYGIKK